MQHNLTLKEEIKQPNKKTLLPTLCGNCPMSKVDAAIFNERPCLEACCGLCKHRPNNGKVGERLMVSNTRRQKPLSASLYHKDE